MEQEITAMLPWLIPVILVLTLWDAVWKLIALWKSARNDHLVWYICIAVFNTIGILPIIYILMHRKRAVSSGESSTE